MDFRGKRYEAQGNAKLLELHRFGFDLGVEALNELLHIFGLLDRGELLAIKFVFLAYRGWVP